MAQAYWIETGTRSFPGHPTYLSATVCFRPSEDDTPNIYHNHEAMNLFQHMVKWCSKNFGAEGEGWVQMTPECFLFENSHQLVFFKLTWG